MLVIVVMRPITEPLETLTIIKPNSVRIKLDLLDKETTLQVSIPNLFMFFYILYFILYIIYYIFYVLCFICSVYFYLFLSHRLFYNILGQSDFLPTLAMSSSRVPKVLLPLPPLSLSLLPPHLTFSSPFLLFSFSPFDSFPKFLGFFMDFFLFPFWVFSLSIGNPLMCVEVAHYLLTSGLMVIDELDGQCSLTTQLV